MNQSVALTVVIPFIGTFLVGIFGSFSRFTATALFLGSLFACFLCSMVTLSDVVNSGTLHYAMGGWKPPVGIEFVVDSFNALVIVIVSGVALLSAVHSLKNMEGEPDARLPRLYGLYLLLLTGLLGMTSTGDVFNLYVFLEITSLSMYTLIAYAGRRAYIATFHYLVMGSIGASFYLIGVGYLYIKTGSLNMADLASIIPSLSNSSTILVAFILMILGMWVKMALFPLHGWLPNAYRYAPNPVSCMIAPLSTKVSVYVMLRVIFSVFTPDYAFSTLRWGPLVVGFASIGIIVASMQALAQRDLKKTFAYIIVAEVGYMVGAVWIANETSLKGAGYHILSDALMTLSLFMFVSIIVYKRGGQSFSHLEGSFERMPFTMIGFGVAALAMIGVPPTCGFFSKWYLIGGAVEAHEWVYVIALLFSSLVNAVLFFRIIEHSLFSSKGHEGHDHHHHSEQVIDEAPLLMLVPFYIVAISLIFLGLVAGPVVEVFIAPILHVGV